jgi:hypothetical protein
MSLDLSSEAKMLLDVALNINSFFRQVTLFELVL